MDKNLKKLLDDNPNMTLKKALESLQKRFNQSLLDLCNNEELKENFAIALHGIVSSYIYQMQVTFDEYSFKDFIYLNYIEDQTKELASQIRNQLENHGSNMIEAFIKSNQLELEKFLEIENNDSLSQEQKSIEQAKLAGTKEEESNRAELEQQANDAKYVEETKIYIENLLKDIISYTEKTSNSRNDFPIPSKLRDTLTELKKYIEEKLNPLFMDSLYETLQNHTNYLSYMYDMQNNFYERTLQELSQYFQERTEKDEPQAEKTNDDDSDILH